MDGLAAFPRLAIASSGLHRLAAGVMRERRPRRVVTREQLAELAGVHPDTVADWVRLGMPVQKRGRRGRSSQYDPVACLAWRRAQHARLSVVDAAKVRNLNAQARLNERRAEQAMDGLLSADDVRLEGRAFVAGVRREVSSIPTRALSCGAVSTAEAATALGQLCAPILADIERWAVGGPLERPLVASPHLPPFRDSP